MLFMPQTPHRIGEEPSRDEERLAEKLLSTDGAPKAAVRGGHGRALWVRRQARERRL